MKKSLATLLLAAMTMVSAVASAETYAVIVGINDYPEPVDAQGNPLKDDEGNVLSDDLYGCVNDANFWKETLLKNFGASEANIHMLLDKQATEANFLKEMRWLIASAKPGDRVFFAYSGHGAQVELDDQPEEADGLTEVICLQDILIPDNLFGDVAKTFRDGGVDSTFAFDSCFSGGIDRDGGNARWTSRKKWVPKGRLSAKQRSNHLTAIEQAELTMAIKSSRGTKGSYAFLLAGQEDQPTSDLQFKDDTPAQGAFTFIVKALLQDDPKMSIEDLIEETKSLLKEFKFEQVPKAEYSDANRPTKPVIG
jgi:hypothetical protein